MSGRASIHYRLSNITTFEQWKKLLIDEATKFYVSDYNNNLAGMKQAWDRLDDLFLSRFCERIASEPHKSIIETTITERVRQSTNHNNVVTPAMLISSVENDNKFEDTNWWSQMRFRKPEKNVKRTTLPTPTGNPYMISCNRL